MTKKKSPPTSEKMGIRNKNIASLGYRLDRSSDVEKIRTLLDVCGLTVFDGAFPGAQDTVYLAASTPAGGVAASIGWTRYADGSAVVHSLAVAPSSRGIGIGASLVASAMLHLRESCEVDALYLGVSGIGGYFKRFGFLELESEPLPEGVRRHPSFSGGEENRLVRRYGVERHGLDKSAFLLIHNTTTDATLPEGSVFWFRQSGAVLEAQYRGGPVVRGHLLGAMQGEALKFVWQSCSQKGDLKRGQGEILIDLLGDGRRELREQLGEDPGGLLLREV